jgi:hypothetical protein
VVSAADSGIARFWGGSECNRDYFIKAAKMYDQSIFRDIGNHRTAATTARPDDVRPIWPCRTADKQQSRLPANRRKQEDTPGGYKRPLEANIDSAVGQPYLVYEGSVLDTVLNESSGWRRRTAG